jgi:hypothetical protein
MASQREDAKAIRRKGYRPATSAVPADEWDVMSQVSKFPLEVDELLQ